MGIRFESLIRGLYKITVLVRSRGQSRHVRFAEDRSARFTRLSRSLSLTKNFRERRPLARSIYGTRDIGATRAYQCEYEIDSRPRDAFRRVYAAAPHLVASSSGDARVCSIATIIRIKMRVARIKRALPRQLSPYSSARRPPLAPSRSWVGEERII